MDYPTLLLLRRFRCAGRMAWSGLLLSILLIDLSSPVAATASARSAPPLPRPYTSPAISAAATTMRRGLTVNPQDREAARQFFQTNYVAVDSAAHNWNGDQATCNAGTTTTEFQSSIALRINYYRAMAGVPADITFNADYTAKAQQAALMMSANDDLSHTPPADWRCYSADGAAAAGSSNLALGTFGPAAIDAYMEDYGEGNNAVGHRRWILYPQTQFMGVGDIPTTNGYSAANALWVFDDNLQAPRPATREAFVAWPPPGYVPYQVLYPQWSFAYADADFTNATVTMSHNGTTIAVTLAPVENGYGENTLVWTPSLAAAAQEGDQPIADTAYEIIINNVQIGEELRTFRYTVTIFDPATADTQPDIGKVLYLPIVRR